MDYFVGIGVKSTVTGFWLGVLKFHSSSQIPFARHVKPLMIFV